MTHRCLLAIFLLSAIACVTHAQQLANDDPSTVYRLNQTVRTVVLDISVVDRQGHPIRGLKAADFRVQEDGIAQQINFFQNEGAHVLPPATRGLTGQALLGKSADAPLTILLLDEISTEPEDLAFARNQIESYLNKQPEQLSTPTTLLAPTASHLKRLSEYTTDRDALLKAIRANNDPPSWYVLRDRQAGFKATNLQTSGEQPPAPRSQLSPSS